MNGHDLNRARDALHSIPPGLPHAAWVRVGMATQAAGLGFDDFDAWSAQADNYKASTARDTWRSFKPDGRVGPGTLFYLAKAEGWSNTAERTAPTIRPTSRPQGPQSRAKRRALA